MDPLFATISLSDCPICSGTPYMSEEGGWAISVECLDCGCHSAELSYKNEQERMEAANNVAALWNMGKVIYSCVGE